MAAIPLPDLPRHKALHGVVVDAHELAGVALISVTAWRGAARPPRRNWFTCRSVALAHAAEIADRDGLTLVDLTNEPGE